MLHGDPPLGFCNAESELKIHISKAINPRIFKASIPQDLKDLIIKCLEVDWRRRISMRDIQFHPYMQRITRELGRAGGDRKSSRLATMHNSVSRNNSTSKLEMRQRFGINRADMISEEKSRNGCMDGSVTPKKPMINVTAVSPLQNQSPGMLLQPPQNSLYTPANMINSAFVQDNLKSKLNIFTQASGVTTTTSSSEAGMLNFD